MYNIIIIMEITMKLKTTYIVYIHNVNDCIIIQLINMGNGTVGYFVH